MVTRFAYTERLDSTPSRLLRIAGVVLAPSAPRMSSSAPKHVAPRENHMRISRRTFLKKSGAAAASTIAAPYIRPRGAWAQTTVKVGILHSLTGTIAIAEASVVDAEKLAIDEINASGGVNGRKIEVIVEDGASDWPTFAEKARKLLDRDKVAAIMGCYTSASRKATLPGVERSKGLLYYPTYYEELQMSPNIMYTAQEATQSAIAALTRLHP